MISAIGSCKLLAIANCAGISLDVFQELGWNVLRRGPSSSLKAIGADAYLSDKYLSLASGRDIYDYQIEQQVRLYPAVAFDALSDFERQRQSDVEVLVLVNIPQVPSSRAMGSAPVFSFDEFMRRTPPDGADWTIVPTTARPLPGRTARGQQCGR